MEKASTPEPKPGRSIRMVRPLNEEGIGVFCVTVGNETAHYVLQEVSCEIGGRGFAVHRLGLGNLYHVRIGKPHECNCECKGFLFRGQCRHILGLLALIREGKL